MENVENVEMENLEIKKYKWTTLGRISDILYRDNNKNSVILLENNNGYILLFVVADPRLDNKLPLIAFDFKSEAIEFFRMWRLWALKNILKAQKQKQKEGGNKNE